MLNKQLSTAMPTNPDQSIHIQSAENGFVVDHSGQDAKGNYSSKKHVFNSGAAVASHLHKHLAPKVKTTSQPNPLKARKDRQRAEALAAVKGK